MMTQGSRNGKLPQKTSIEEKVILNPWDVGYALRDLTDLVEKAMLPYILLGDAARQMKDGCDGFSGNELKIDKIEWAMFERNLTPEIKSLFNTWMFEQWGDKGFKYQILTVPVYVHVVTRRYNFFELPDMVYYGPDMYKIANPFEKFWKARFIVK